MNNGHFSTAESVDQVQYLPMPNPTASEVESPLHQAIFDVINPWDINVPTHYSGYCSGNGSHVKMIVDAIEVPLQEAVKATVKVSLELAEARKSFKRAPAQPDVSALESAVWMQLGIWSVEIATSGQMAPTQAMIEAIKALARGHK